jgi:hypothetical protein
MEEKHFFIKASDAICCDRYVVDVIIRNGLPWGGM